MSRIFTPELFLVIAAILWGGTFVVIKLALDSVPPFLFLAVRFWLAGIVTLLLYRKTLFSKANRRWDYIFPAFLVAGSALLGYAFQTIGLVYTTATQSGFMTGAYVVFTLITDCHRTQASITSNLGRCFDRRRRIIFDFSKWKIV